MKTNLKLLLMFLLLVSCQNDNKKDNSVKSEVKKEKTSKDKNKDASKELKPEKMLTKAQFEEFFPKKIDAYNLINVSVTEKQGIGTASYIKGKDYGNGMTYYVTDGRVKGSAAIRNFEKSYQSNQDWPEGTEFISKERDGFKTVALLRHNYNNYKVSVLYNNRFVLTVEGHEKPDELWTYLKQADLQMLDSY